MMFARPLAIACLIAVASTGCTDDPTLAELSKDELRQLCDDTSARATERVEPEAFARFQCLAAQAQTDRACDPEALETCVRLALVEPRATRIDCSRPFDGADVSACDVTVDEYRACFDASIDLFNTYADMTCASNDDGGRERFEEPASCVAIKDRCPQLVLTAAR